MLNDDAKARLLSIPSGYASIKLGMKLHPTQARVLDALFQGAKTKISFRAGNECGKSSCVITAAILYSLDYLNAQVISTAAAYRQITGQLIPNLKRYANLYPKWEFLDNAISIGGIQRYVGFSTDSESTFQGWHESPGTPLLIIVDEAAGVKEAIFRAIDRCKPTYLLVAGSPLNPEGIFYDIETKTEFMKQFKHFKLTQPECPWIKQADVDALIAKWGKDHPLVLSSVYADFALNSENTLLSLSEFEDCENHPPEAATGQLIRQVGIDWAAGRAQNVMVFRIGNRLKIIKKWRQKDTMAAVGEVLIELQRLKKQYGLLENEVWADADGLGVGPCDRLKELGWAINYFHGNAAASKDDYKNLITEAWMEGCKAIRNKEVALPEEDELKGQILSRRQKRHSSGRMMLESKEDMSARGIESPDVADAFFMAALNMHSGVVTKVHRIEFQGAGRGYCGMFS